MTFEAIVHVQFRSSVVTYTLCWSIPISFPTQLEAGRSAYQSAIAFVEERHGWVCLRRSLVLKEVARMKKIEAIVKPWDGGDG